jgi:hypothetical protein
MPALRPTLVLALLLTGLSKSAAGQTPRDSAIAVVQEFFRAMRERDTAAARAVLTPDGHAVATLQGADSVTARITAHTGFVKQLAGFKETLRERMWDPTVMIRGPIAIVWAPYDFHRGETFSHCGVDAFSLVRGASGWRIVDIIYTVEPKGCEASPLDLPAPEGPALLDRLVGRWRMAGHVRGKSVIYRLEAARTLGGRFVELHMTDVATPPGYEARVFLGHDPKTGQVIAHWLDGFGAAFSVPHGVGAIRGDTVRFEIPYADGPFRDTFVYRRKDGAWTFTLEAGDGAGNWKPFGEYLVTPARKPR